jgi:hypothetical protein
MDSSYWEIQHLPCYKINSFLFTFQEVRLLRYMTQGSISSTEEEIKSAHVQGSQRA